jgi:sugar lactone lactonase YvrE
MGGQIENQSLAIGSVASAARPLEVARLNRLQWALGRIGQQRLIGSPSQRNRSHARLPEEECTMSVLRSSAAQGVWMARLTSLMLGLLLTFALSCALAASAAAHSDDLGNPRFDGRLPGQPDFVRKGDVTFRFNPGRAVYEIHQPGQPTAVAHVDPEETKTSALAEAASIGGWVELPTSELATVCRASGPRIVFVYTHRPSDKTATPTSTIRSIAKRMNWKINSQSSQSSAGSRALKMITNCVGGEITVYDVSTSDNTYATIYSAVTTALNPLVGKYPVKYLVFDHGTAGEIGGLGSVVNDNRKTWLNGNALYTGLGVVYNIANAWTAHVPVHELFHTLGASQGFESPVAPFSTGGSHCTDGIDILCYNDVSARSGNYSETRCPASEGYETPSKVPIDCGTDTYFDALPEFGSWLDKYWNVAGFEDPFLAGPPSATIWESPNVGGDAASVYGTVSTGGYETSYYAEYGTTETYGSKTTPAGTLGVTGESEIIVEIGVGGLKPNTLYHYRVVAANAAGTSKSTDGQFTTLPVPSVVMKEAAKVTANGAELKGTVNPNGHAAEYYFEYGETSEYGSSSPTAAAGSGTADVAVAQQVEGLKPGRTYHVRLVATNEYGTTYGNDLTFETPIAYASSFGSAGNGNGQFISPQDIAVDASGNLYVGNQGGPKVKKFNSKGEFILQFGSYGSGNGQFQSISGLVVGPSGDIWVVDRGHNRVERFNSKGEYLSQFSAFTPFGIAADLSGNLWVCNQNGKIEEFDESGKFIKVVGSEGSGKGQFFECNGIDIGPGGKVWAVDSDHDRVSVFSKGGEFLFDFGSTGSGKGQLDTPVGIDVDAQGHVWVGEGANDRVQEFNQEGEYVTQFGSYGSGAGQLKLGSNFGLASDDAGNLWITDTGNDRIQRWLIPEYVPTYQSSFGSAGNGNGQFISPQDIAVDASGNLYVGNQGGPKVKKFNSKGEFILQFGSYGSGNGQFQSISGLVVGPSGDIWVVDRGHNRVERFNSKGEYLSQFSAFTPFGIAADLSGNLWVCNQNGKIEEFDESGKFIKVVGSEGSGKGQFFECNGIDIGPGGKVWAVDSDHDRVSVFSKGGEFLFDFGSTGSGKGQLDTPVGIDVDAQGHVWVGEGANDRVQEFNQEGEYVTQFGSYGSGAGQLKLGSNFGLASDDAGNLWITDTGNDRIQRWGF